MDDFKPMNALVSGPVFRFAGWPNDQVPRRAAGVYTIWRHEEFIYVGYLCLSRRPGPAQARVRSPSKGITG
jgi:hypothetical protein